MPERGAAPPQRQLAHTVTVVALVLVVSMGAGLRFHRLDAQSLWSDELASWEQSRYASLGEVIERGVRPHPYPPAYQILLYAVERHIGDSEIELRMPSAVAGVLAILALFFLGRRLFGEREGLVAAVLLAFSYKALYFSQEARAYSCLMLFAIVSSFFWLRVQRELEARERPTPQAFAGYVAAAGLAMYLHYFGLLLVAVQMAGLVALYATRRRALVWVGAIGIALFALYLPWLPYLIEEFRNQPVYIAEPGLVTIARYWRFVFHSPGDWLMWVAALLVGAALARWGIGRLRADERPGLRAWLTSPTVLVVLWLVLPFVLAYVRSVTAVPILNQRNLIISMPAAYLLAARSLTLLLARPALQFAAVGLCSAGMLHAIFAGYYDVPTKSQFREAAAVVAMDRDRDPAPVIAHAWTRHRFDYYLERTGARQRVDLLAGRAQDVPALRAYLERERPRSVWLLDAHRRFEAGFLDAVEDEHELVEHVALYGASARLYRRRGEVAAQR